jgi:uridylate kinase
MKNKRNIVIALGGSVAFPEEIDTYFLRKFCTFIRREIKKGDRFIIVCGGGYITRKYQKSATKINRVSNEDKDWLGIHATRLNAHFLRTIFKRESNPTVFDSRFKIKKFGKYPLIIGSGWRPGWSTDFVAIQIAVDFKIKEVIVLGKPSHVYTCDFEKDSNAKPLNKLSWKDYLKIISSRWIPGLNTPVDPIAARLAKKENIKVVVAYGKDLDNLSKILKNKRFKGTALS